MPLRATQVEVIAGNIGIGSVTLPTGVVAGQKNVTTAGTDVVLASTQALISGVTVKAKSTNTGLIFVGPEGVSSSTGFILSAGDMVFIETDNLADIWIDSSVSGEGVSYIGG